jgi:hypothetical protein
MKPVDQDIFVNDPQGRPGNCLQACVASILELPLNEVPHFVTVPDDTWFDQMVKWIESRGYALYDSDGLSCDEDYVFAIGKSPRGVSHVVIYHKGEMVHDPHFSRAGITDIKWSASIKKNENGIC